MKNRTFSVAGAFLQVAMGAFGRWRQLFPYNWLLHQASDDYESDIMVRCLQKPMSLSD